MPEKDLHQLSINTIRCLAIDAIQKANSGHPGMPMGCAPIAYQLYTKYMKHNPANPKWLNRDLFILSAGHGSMLLYSILHLSGFDLSLDELKNFRQWGSKTPGHPESGHSPGVETTTGPLGQGFANGVGMALAETYLAVTEERVGRFRSYGWHVQQVDDGNNIEAIENAIKEAQQEKDRPSFIA